MLEPERKWYMYQRYIIISANRNKPISMMKDYSYYNLGDPATENVKEKALLESLQAFVHPVSPSSRLPGCPEISEDGSIGSGRYAQIKSKHINIPRH